MTRVETMAGDEIRVRTVEMSERTGTVLRVVGPPGQRRYEVRWEDGHESLYFPADGAPIIPGRPREEPGKRARPPGWQPIDDQC